MVLRISLPRSLTQSRHLRRLAGGGENVAPERSLGIDLFALRCREGHGNMGELVVPEANDHIRPTAHPSMHGAVPKEQAKDRVMGVRGHAPDGVAWIDVLDA